MNVVFKVVLTLRIDWSEMDMYGHVNNVSYFKYVQAARVNYWEQVGITEHHAASNIGAMLAGSKCTFKRPLFYPGTVRIESRVEFIKNTSFGIVHRLLDSDGNIAAEAEDVIVMFDFTKNEKSPFPPFIKQRIEELEGKSF
jgi:acyl-CoA thioester hydrolase